MCSPTSPPPPSFQPLGNLLIGRHRRGVLPVFGHGDPDAARDPALAAVGCRVGALGLVGVAAARSPSLESEALTSIWTAPIAILLAWWCSARVLTLQGSLITAEAGRQRPSAPSISRRGTTSSPGYRT